MRLALTFLAFFALLEPGISQAAPYCEVTLSEPYRLPGNLGALAAGTYRGGWVGIFRRNDRASAARSAAEGCAMRNDHLAGPPSDFAVVFRRKLLDRCYEALNTAGTGHACYEN